MACHYYLPCICLINELISKNKGEISLFNFPFCKLLFSILRIFHTPHIPHSAHHIFHLTHILSFLLFIVFNWNASIFLASKSCVHSFGYFSRETSRGSVRPIRTFLQDKIFHFTLVRENLSNFANNLQTSGCFYRSGNHGLTQSSHEVYDYVAVAKS